MTRLTRRSAIRFSRWAINQPPQRTGLRFAEPRPRSFKSSYLPPSLADTLMLASWFAKATVQRSYPPHFPASRRARTVGLSLGDSLLPTGKASRQSCTRASAKQVVHPALSLPVRASSRLSNMKPNAPVEIRGELKPIHRAAGRPVCKLLPHAARSWKGEPLSVVTHPYSDPRRSLCDQGVPTSTLRW